MKPHPERDSAAARSLTAAPTKPVKLPDWAEAALSTLRVPTVNPTWTDTMLPNKLRRHRQERQDESHGHRAGQHPPRDDAAGAAGQRWRVGRARRTVLVRHDHARSAGVSEGARRHRGQRKRGIRFLLRVTKTDFARGVELLADNLLHPRCPRRRSTSSSSRPRNISRDRSRVPATRPTTR